MEKMTREEFLAELFIIKTSLIEQTNALTELYDNYEARTLDYADTMVEIGDACSAFEDACNSLAEAYDFVTG